jgi:hypothetical protein
MLLHQGSFEVELADFKRMLYRRLHNTGGMGSVALLAVEHKRFKWKKL